ncbi:DegT/DnrJ/EryC1/StrS family aminotransferase [Streptomyces sp. NPDC001787]|uniref:DegT/DnrJ/EryC1/StrS family aminotransferase n=1 Tax=Streptomyces sp. NPDC001787 TaxID=3154523 RepID=UPI0033234A63
MTADRVNLRTMPVRLWPWWSQHAIDLVGGLLECGDLAGADAGHQQIDACEQMASHTLAAGRPVMMCDSGTAALETLYAALGLGRGSEVLVASHSFRATVTAMLPAGLVPVLCDADPGTGHIDLDDAATRVTARTAALVVTHTWGRPADLDRIRAFADRHHLVLLEDCSHAHGTRWQGRAVGTVGDAAVWSTGTTKMVSGGKAGLLTCTDRQVWERAMVLAQPKHRAAARVDGAQLLALTATGAGHNRRVHPVAAVLVTDHLIRLPHTLAAKNERQSNIETVLAAELPWLQPLPAPQGHVDGALYKWHWRSTGRPGSDTARVLSAAGIRARLPAAPLHRLPLFTDDRLGALLGLRRLVTPDPATFPGTRALLEGLVEIDTRDMYESLPDGDTDPAVAALERAASLTTKECA